MKPEIIVTVEYETPFIDEVLHNSLVSGIRINTGYNNFKTSCDDKIKNLLRKTRALNKKLWMDLKGRELRILYSQNNEKRNQWVKLNHKISVNTPTEMYYNDGTAYALIEKIRKKRNLKIDTHIPIIFGKGTPINISDNSLSVIGYYTKTDKRIMKLARNNNIHDYMISFVENASEIEELLDFDPRANIVAKIESKKGMRFIKDIYPSYDNKIRLMAARGDLYVELNRPHHIINALEDIIEADPNAILGSRIYSSIISKDLMPACTDLTDISYLLDLGYKTFLIGDELREEESNVMSAIGVIKEIAKNKRKKHYINKLNDAYKNYELNLLKLENILLRERGYVFKPPKEDEQVVVLLSGGLDSVVMTGLILNEFKCSVHPIYIKRGARNEELEMKAFYYFIDFYKDIHKGRVGEPYVLEVDVPPKEFKKHYDRAMVETVGLPLRNSTLQNYAVMYAKSKGIKTIFSGSVGEDYYEPESGLLSLRANTVSTCINLGDWDYQITSPLLEDELNWDFKITKGLPGILYKPDLISYSEVTYPHDTGFRIPYEKSRSCFSSSSNACGACSACIKRIQAVNYFKNGGGIK